MPFLRFSKDRRGYENTYLLHASRRRNDKDRPALLYWFRTPPHVKVGRSAFDEDAIRALEDQHPGVEFDWPRILATRAPATDPEPERPSRRSAPRRAAAAVTPPVSPPPAITSTAPAMSTAPETVSGVPDAPAPLPPPSPVIPPPRPSDPIEPSAEPARRFVRVFDRVSAPEPAGPPSAELEAAPTVESPSPVDSNGDDTNGEEERPHHLSDPSVVERMLGSERLGRLRGQYAATLARIGRRIADASLAESLRAVAERINPDAWVTEDEVRQGLQGAAAVDDELARHIGRRRRHRRRGRRGGSLPGQPLEAPPGAENTAADNDEPEAEDGGEDDGEAE